MSPEAVRAGAVGVVTGRAYEEPRTLQRPDTPLTDAIVTLLPRSEHILADLDALKRETRGSLDASRDAATGIRLRLEAYANALRTVGAAELLHATAVNQDGTFTLQRVPAGPWLLYASRWVFIPKRGGSSAPRQSGTFQLPPPVIGHWAVTLWLRELVVTDGGVHALELTDRNVWFTGLADEHDTAGSPDPGSGRRPKASPR